MAGPNRELCFVDLFDVDLLEQSEYQLPNHDNCLPGGFRHFTTEPYMFDLVADVVSEQLPLPQEGMAVSNPDQAVDTAQLLDALEAPAADAYALDASGFDLGLGQGGGDYGDLFGECYSAITPDDLFSGLPMVDKAADPEVPLFPASPQLQQPTTSPERTASHQEQVPPFLSPSNAAHSLQEVLTSGISHGVQQGAAASPLAGFQGGLVLPSTPPPKADSGVQAELGDDSSRLVNQQIAGVPPQAPMSLKLPSVPAPGAAPWGLNDLEDFFGQGPEKYITANPHVDLADSLLSQPLSPKTALAVGSITPGNLMVAGPSYQSPSYPSPQTYTTNIIDPSVQAGLCSHLDPMQAPTRFEPALQTGWNDFDPAIFDLSMAAAEGGVAPVPGQLASPLGPKSLAPATLFQPEKVQRPAQAPIVSEYGNQQRPQNRMGTTPRCPVLQQETLQYAQYLTGARRPQFDPRDYDVPWRPKTWGTTTRPEFFSYTEHSEWSEEVRLNKQEASYYLHNIREQGRKLKIWIQHLPTKHTRRLPEPWSGKCRYRHCPAPNRTILKGFYRVAFDERPETSGKSTDPFHNAGYMHLHCLEKIFDLIELVNFGVAELDLRVFAREGRNPMSVVSHQPRLRQVYEQWRAEQTRAHAQHYAQRAVRGWPRDPPKTERLWHVLTRHAVEYEPDNIRKVRASRMGMSLDKHLGDLDKYVAGMKKRKQLHRTARNQIARQTEFISTTPSPPRMRTRSAARADAWALEREMKRVWEEIEEETEAEEVVVVAVAEPARKRQRLESEATSPAPMGVGLDPEDEYLFLGDGEDSQAAEPWTPLPAKPRTKRKRTVSGSRPWDAHIRQ